MKSSFMISVLSPDIKVGTANAISVGFLVDLSPCPDGRCAAAPVNRCFDRVLDGDETDVDCGGAVCPPCPPGADCVTGADCDSKVCQGPAGGPVCAAPTKSSFGRFGYAAVCAVTSARPLNVATPLPLVVSLWHETHSGAFWRKKLTIASVH
jgi:hypothetical protein